METTATGVLAEAGRLIGGERHQAYGPAADDFAETAKIWTVILRRKGKLVTAAELDAHDIALCMTALKLSREAHVPGRDNCVDGAGYFALAHQVTR